MAALGGLGGPGGLGGLGGPGGQGGRGESDALAQPPRLHDRAVGADRADRAATSAVAVMACLLNRSVTIDGLAQDPSHAATGSDHKRLSLSLIRSVPAKR
jgi:hypothetical protein